MRAIKINPNNKTITEIELDYENKGIHAIYEAGEYDCFDVLRIQHGDYIYLDDEGLFKPLPRWRWGQYPNQLAGIGIILGCDREGETIDAQINLSDVIAWVVWL